MTAKAYTLFDKLWAQHQVRQLPDVTYLLYIDRHLTHECTSAQAFQGLRDTGRTVRRPGQTLGVVDHIVPTTDRRLEVLYPEARTLVDLMVANCAEFGIDVLSMSDSRQGIVHVVGPELGFTLPGMTVVCGDSHTATIGALGTLAFGIGTSEVEHVLATQTLVMSPYQNMRVVVDGTLPFGVTAKDVILAIIGHIGTAGGTGHVKDRLIKGLDSIGMTLEYEADIASYERLDRQARPWLYDGAELYTYDTMYGKPVV